MLIHCYAVAHEHEVTLQRWLYLLKTRLEKRAVCLCVRMKMLSASVGPCRDDSVNSVVSEAGGGAAPAVWMLNYNIDFQYSNSTRLNDL